MKLRSIPLWLATVGMAVTTAHADTVTANLHFDKMLPFTGIVYAPDSDDEAKLAQRGILDQHEKQFSSPLVVVSPGAELKIKNSDEFAHNIYADDHKQTGISFDLGRIESHDEFHLPVRWEKDSLLRLGCKIHPKMKTYIANIRSHHYSVIDFMPGKFDYEVTLQDVPAQEGEVRVLLPDLAPLSATVKAGQSKTVQVSVNGHNVGYVDIKREAH